MNKEDVQNKEDYVNFILFELYKKVHPIDFGNFFMELMPTSGIDSFRDLLDELFENRLVTKKSEPNGHISGMPHLVKMDLKYGISLKGIEHLKRHDIISNHIIKKKDVFVTYSWDDEEHNDKVISFTNFLRSKGFEAEIDRLMTQKESATDFNKMMHQAMTDYNKVIIVLSKGYKEKATAFKGGVGNEYSLIIKDIENSKNKYILVSFEKISDEITPLNFKGRHIIDLTIKENLNELFSKLMDEEILDFSQVGTNKPQIIKKVIPAFEIEENKILSNFKIPEIEFEFDVDMNNKKILFELVNDEFDVDKIPYIKRRAENKKDNIFKVVGNISKEKLANLNSDWERQSVLETIDEIKKKLELRLKILFYTNHYLLADYNNINIIIANICKNLQDPLKNYSDTIKLDVFQKEPKISFGIHLTKEEILELSKIKSDNWNEIIESLRYNIYGYSASDLSKEIIINKLIPSYISEINSLIKKERVSFEKFNWNYIDSYEIGLG